MDIQNQESEIHKIVAQRQSTFDQRNISWAVENDVPDLVLSAPLQNSFQLVLDHVISQCQPQASVLITLVRTLQGLEIEIADTSDDSVETNRLSIQIARAEQELATVAGRLEVMPCPQGGNAYVLCVPITIQKAVA